MIQPNTLRIALALLLAFLGTLRAKEIPNCNFEDTVDLTNAHKFPNGSYLYGHEILIPAAQVGIYDYEEVFGGKRISSEPHPRGCICNVEGGVGVSCMKFCCQHPVREHISKQTNQCDQTKEALTYSPYLNVTQRNGTSLPTDITKDLVVVQGIPCEKAYAFDKSGLRQDWQLFENGSLSLYSGEVSLTKRDYCLMFAPHGNGKGLMLTPMLCPEPVLNEEPTLDVVSSIADFISTLFIILALLVYLIMPDLQDLQGKCLICFLISLALASAALSIIAFPNAVFPKFLCGFMGFTGYFFFLASFCWLNVICYNMFKAIQGSNVQPVDGKKQLTIYSAYACGIPFFLTMILIIIQNTNMPDDYKSGIGGDYCWFDPTNWSAMIYYFGMNAVLLCLDVSFYFVVVLSLRTTLKSQPGAKDILLQLKSANQYGRLLLIMTISWVFDTISNIESVRHADSQSLWFYMSSFVSAIYGFMIFVVFSLEPFKKWRHRRICLRNGYAREDADVKDFESIEISSKSFS